MDNFTESIRRAELLVRTACVLKEQGKDLQAFLFLDLAVHTYSKALYHALKEDEDLYKAIEDCAVRYGRLREQFRLEAFSSPTKCAGSHVEGEIGSIEAQSADKFKNRLLHWKDGPGFSEIIGLAALKEIFYNCIIMLPSSRYAARFSRTGSGSFHQHILLYGTPGNGKTEIVRAYHQEAKGTRLYIVTPADILSKYIGESESKLDELFQDAKSNGPSIIFLDEIDGLFSVIKRDANNVSLLNQFLQLMEETHGVQVIGATNYPWEMPDATLRRFAHIVHVPLPNKEERTRLLRKYLGTEGLQIKNEDLQNIARVTKGYSCSDIKRMTNAALRIPQKTVIKATYFKRMDDDNKWTPCDKAESCAVRMNFVDVDAEDLAFPLLTTADLEAAAKSNSMTTHPLGKGGETLKQIAEFASKIGCDGRDGTLGRQTPKNSLTCWVGDGTDAQPIQVRLPEDNQIGLQSSRNLGADSMDDDTKTAGHKSNAPVEAPTVLIPSVRHGMAKFWSMLYKKRSPSEK